MRLHRVALSLCLTVLLAACQSGPGQPSYDPDSMATASSGDSELFGERADARTRSKAHNDLAAAYYGLGNLAVALQESRIAVQADPTYASAYNMQGLINIELRDNNAAEQSFLRGLQLAPQDPDLNHNYGSFLCRVGREKEGVQRFMQAVKNPLYQTPAKSYATAAQCVQRIDPEESDGLYRNALRLEPNNPTILQQYAGLQYQRGKLDEARDLMARYNQAAAEPNAEALWLQLRIERKLGNTRDEASYAAQLGRRYPNSPQTQALQRGAYD